MTNNFSILAWEIPWTEELGRFMVHGVANSQTQLSDQHYSEQNRQNPALKGVILQWRRQKESGQYTDSSMCRELHLWSSGPLNAPSEPVQVQSLVRELDPICSN